MIERALIAGMGSIGKRHLSILRLLLPNVDLRVLSHRKFKKVPETLNIIEFEEIFHFQPQIAVIANPSPFHLEVASKLMSIGCHILVEKPLSDKVEGVEELIKLRNHKNTVAHVGYNLRFDAGLAFFREQILSKLVGDVFSVRCEVGQFLPTWRQDRDYRDSVSAKRELGGGVLLELSHELDYLRWVFGEVKTVRATVLKQSKLDLNVEDYAHLFICFCSGGVTASLNMDFIRHDYTRNCKVIGEKGTIRWDATSGLVEIWKQNECSWKTIFENSQAKEETYHSEWKAFLQAVQYKRSAGANLEDGLAVLKIIDAARLSDRNGGKKVYI